MKEILDFNVLDVICDVMKSAKKSQFMPACFKDCKKEISFLCDYLQTNETEVLLFVAVYSETYNNSSYPDIDRLARFFDVDALDVLQKNAAIRNLIEAKLILVTDEYYTGGRSHNRRNRSNSMPYAEDTFVINSNAAKAIIENIPIAEYEEELLEITNVDFVELISSKVDDNDRGMYPFRKLLAEIQETEQTYKDLQVVKKTNHILSNIEDRVLFYMICYASSTSRFGASLKDAIETLYYSVRKRVEIATMCRNKEHPLFTKELVYFVEKSDSFDLLVELDDKGSDIYLDDFAKLCQSSNKVKDFIESEKIDEKKLFFSPKLEEQVSFLRSNIEKDKFIALQERLKQEKMPQGICALFYGCPGTGKTETAQQLAKSTGRGIIHVDISQSKSCWFGESEKRIKRIFQDYRKVCKSTDLKPILLFNEADAIFSKRKDTQKSSVAQTENAIQNIILEEMESLDGILIATTNLTGNFDSAFERRFLFKIEFEKPSIEAKQHIWQDKLSFLSQDDSQSLAKEFDFSGGEIDNIVRKCIMNDVIRGKQATLAEITDLCRQEHIAREASGGCIGFAV